VIRTILFDLDETLYPRGTGIMEEIGALILSYIRTHLNLSTAEADALRRHYFERYGTTMRGLQLNHHIDADEFLHYVHDIPLQEYLQPNPHLGAVLGAIRRQKVVFTNASREHANQVLTLLGIGHHFDRIVDVRDVDYVSKPQPGAYRRVCDLLNVRPGECVFVEDNVRNLRPAKEYGMTTVLVSGDGMAEGVDYSIGRIEQVGALLRDVILPLESMEA
jgi:putative hydrolase of the HAD superfamily